MRRRLVAMLWAIGLGASLILAADRLLPKRPEAIRPTPTPAPEIGRVRHAGAAPFWVNEGAYLLVERALEERDERTLEWIRRTYEHLDVPTGTAVRVLKIEGGRCQVEILGVPYIGRRGWAPCASLDP